MVTILPAQAAIGTKVRRNGLDFKIAGYHYESDRYMLVPATTPISYVSRQSIDGGITTDPVPE